jgi:glycosyltransferase involved in cell wall biosynthesis
MLLGGSFVRVLVTADTITGTWAYARELVTGLVSRGVHVTLVSFGDVPLPEQTGWIDGLHGLDYRPTAFRLEWMQEGEQDLEESSTYLRALVSEIAPDLLLLTQYCYGNLDVPVPRVVVAHGDLVSWWVAVHGHEPRDTRWMQWYRSMVSEGIAGATALVAPSEVMLNAIRAHYGSPAQQRVIHNGRNPIFFNPYVAKQDCVLSVGKMWDAGKQVSLLTQRVHRLPVCIVSPDQPCDRTAVPLRADVKLKTDEVDVAFRGAQTEAQLRVLYSRAAIYAATSRYEPFGMAPLEAALSRCAIVANDIPIFREIWGDAAIYFRRNDPESLAETLQELAEDRERCRTHGNLAYQRARTRFTAKRMLDEYLDLCRNLAAPRRVAA